MYFFLGFFLPLFENRNYYADFREIKYVDRIVEFDLSIRIFLDYIRDI